jgi:hypothetical protein
MGQCGRMLAWVGQSHYYTEPSAWQLAHLAARKEPGKTRERTVYALTDKGAGRPAPVRATPVSFMPLESDALLRRSSASSSAKR